MQSRNAAAAAAAASSSDDDDSSSSSHSSDRTSSLDSSVSTGKAPSSDRDYTSDFEDQSDDGAAAAPGVHAHRAPTANPWRRDPRFTRATSLGDLRGFSDKMLLTVATHLMPRDLVRLGAASWVLFAVAHDEPIWRRLVLLLCVDRKRRIGNFCFHGSWRRTMLRPRRLPNRRWDEQALLPPTTAATPVAAASADAASPVAEAPGDAAASRAGFWLIDAPNRPRYSRLRTTRHQRWYNVNTSPLNAGSGGGRVPGFNTRTAPMLLGGVDRRERLTYLDFVEQYEKPNRPVVITDAARDWPARRTWLPDSFVARYGERLFNINVRSTKGYRFRMRGFDYFAYAAACDAEKFLYIFDKRIFRHCRALLRDYHVPVYFGQDLFELMDEADRPDYRWLLIGPNGSGSPFHTDPHMTSAWNCVLSGAKRVTFYPPDVVPPGVDKKLINSDVYPSDDMMFWYRHRLPKAVQKLDAGDASAEPLRPIECVVLPGEMLFIPSGWWHQVQNLGLTIAVTQNFCSLHTFPYVAHDMNTTSGRQIRKDFKCALAESPYKALADFIVVHKKRAPPELIQRRPPPVAGIFAAAATAPAPATGASDRSAAHPADGATTGAAETHTATDAAATGGKSESSLFSRILGPDWIP
jgi:hypothetical protein